MDNNKISPSNEENKSNENKALIVGFALIVVVALVTLFRSETFSNKTDKTSKNQASTQNKAVPNVDYQTISAKDLQKKLSKNKDNLTLLDIRTFDEYIGEHIVDAVNIPPDEFPTAPKLDAKKSIIIIGKIGTDPNIEKVVDELKKADFNDITVLAGGMEAWKNIAGMVVTYGDPTSFVDQSKVSYVEAIKLKEAMDQKVPVFILDVRTAEEFSKGHIPSARNLPFEELEKRRSEVPSLEKIVVTGINELQEFQASVQLYDMNLNTGFVLKGGIPAWQAKGFELVK